MTPHLTDYETFPLDVHVARKGYALSSDSQLRASDSAVAKTIFRLDVANPPEEKVTLVGVNVVT
jgi:hypothetical protein